MHDTHTLAEAELAGSNESGAAALDTLHNPGHREGEGGAACHVTTAEAGLLHGATSPGPPGQFARAGAHWITGSHWAWRRASARPLSRYGRGSQSVGCVSL